MATITPKEMPHDIFKMKVYNGGPEYALKSIKGIRQYIASWLKHSMNFTLGGSLNGYNHAGGTACCSHESKEDRKEKKRGKHRL